jgi:hypothetical protein
MNKYYPPIPIDQAVYKRWLQRRATSLARRDRKYLQDQGKNTKTVVVKEYKTAIHDSVCKCQGKDAYTGEALDWTLLSKWNNEDAKKFKRNYKKEFALLPTVDHVDELGIAKFKICAWRTNDAKNDLSLNELIDFCKKIIKKNT